MASKQLTDKLWESVRFDHADMVKFYYTAVGENNVNGENLFLRALEYKRKKVLLYLIKETNIDINRVICGEGLLFHTVCQNVRVEETFKLITQKINLQLMHNVHTHSKVNAFLIACRYYTPHNIKILHQELKLNVFQKNNENRGVIHFAAMNKNVEVIKYVLTMIEGINPFEEDESGANALFIACEYSNFNVFLYLFYLYLHKSIPSFYPVNIYQFIEDRFHSLISKCN